MLPCFDSMRNCLGGVLDQRVTVTWVDTLETLNKEGLPIEVKMNEHTVWGECEDGRTFVGGVSLFGRVIGKIKIDDFGCSLPGRCFSSTNPWLDR